MSTLRYAFGRVDERRGLRVRVRSDVVKKCFSWTLIHKRARAVDGRRTTDDNAGKGARFVLYDRIESNLIYSGGSERRRWSVDATKMMLTMMRRRVQADDLTRERRLNACGETLSVTERG